MHDAMMAPLSRCPVNHNVANEHRRRHAHGRAQSGCLVRNTTVVTPTSACPWSGRVEHCHRSPCIVVTPTSACPWSGSGCECRKKRVSRNADVGIPMVGQGRQFQARLSVITPTSAYPWSGCTPCMSRNPKGFSRKNSLPISQTPTLPSYPQGFRIALQKRSSMARIWLSTHPAACLPGCRPRHSRIHDALTADTVFYALSHSPQAAHAARLCADSTRTQSVQARDPSRRASTCCVRS